MLADYKNLFKLRGGLDKQTNLLLAIVGTLIFVGIWILLTFGASPVLHPATLPSPFQVFSSYGDLIKDNNLFVNIAKSVGLNLSGYVVAIFLSIVLGFVVGLLPLFRGLFQRLVEAIRFVPLTATTGIFIVWFGIGITMKSYFMAFGIFIFLLPVVVQRIDEVKDVYLKTVYTLGATNWQTITSVYIPSVLSRLVDDIRIMTAISWTYIVFVESIGEGGLGYLLTYGAKRQGRIDKVFALLILIIMIGVFQDKFFAYIDRKLFPHKYQNKGKYDHTSKDKEDTLLSVVIDYCWLAFTWIALGLYFITVLDELFGVLGNINLIHYLFGGTAWVIHTIFVGAIIYKFYSLLSKKEKYE
ncbi:MAG: ABC transporter permease subunit [Saprospiraceae bacterium]